MCGRIWESQPVSEKINDRYSSSKMLMEKKRILLKDKASDWLHSGTAASLLDIKGNNVVKIILFRFSQIRSHMWASNLTN